MGRGAYLEKLIEKKGYTVRSLSRESGVAYTTIRSMIERDLKNASIDNVIKVCNVLEISTDELANYTDEYTMDDNIHTVAESQEAYKINNLVSLPLYGDVAAGELMKIDPVTKSNLDQITLPKDILGKHRSNKDLFVLKVNGESMNELIPNGSYVVAKPMDADELKDNDIVIYSFDGEYSLKRFRRDDEDQVLIFSPESSDKKFRDRVIPYNTDKDLKVHGKVILYSVTLD